MKEDINLIRNITSGHTQANRNAHLHCFQISSKQDYVTDRSNFQKGKSCCSVDNNNKHSQHLKFYSLVTQLLSSFVENSVIFCVQNRTGTWCQELTKTFVQLFCQIRWQNWQRPYIIIMLAAYLKLAMGKLKVIYSAWKFFMKISISQTYHAYVILLKNECFIFLNVIDPGYIYTRLSVPILSSAAVKYHTVSFQWLSWLC